MSCRSTVKPTASYVALLTSRCAFLTMSLVIRFSASDAVMRRVVSRGADRYFPRRMINIFHRIFLRIQFCMEQRGLELQ